jgi:hypothetical protein
MPAILALLAKDWKYFAIIGALLGVIAYIYHDGEKHIERADAKVAAAQIVHNSEVQNVIKAKVAAAVADYSALAPIPVPARVPVLVCQSPGSGVVPQSQAAASGSNSEGASVPTRATGAYAGFNPAPAVSATGSKADAEIEHLQKKIILLQALVSAYQDGGLVEK